MTMINSSLSFGDLLRYFRDAAGLTQEDLAEQAGLSVQAISQLERGVRQSPRRDTVQLIAHALGLYDEERATLDIAARRRPQEISSGAPTQSDQNQPVLHSKTRSFPPLVGRHVEVALLHKHLARDTSLLVPPVLLLAGEPGIGKSRLLNEAMNHAQAEEWTVLHGRCQRQSSQDPYAPLLEAIELYIQNQSPAQLRLALQHCAWLVRLLPELAAGPIEPLPKWTVPSHQETRLIMRSVVRFFANIAGPAGTVLVLDDLQWAGPDALNLLAATVHTDTPAPIRVIAAYRDTEVHTGDALSTMLADLAHASLVTRRTMAPLDRGETLQLLNQLVAADNETGLTTAHNLPQAQISDRQREYVLQQVGGVPFFLVSWVQEARQGLLVDDPSSTVPWDVAQGLRQRVAALPDSGRDLVGVAAVVGGEVPRSLLTAITARPEVEVLSALDAACRARLLEESGEHAYRFTHDVIREVIELDLGAAKRSLLHRQIADALQSMTGEPPADRIAYHYAHTQGHQEAAHWSIIAGDRAAAARANVTALSHYLTAREHLLLMGADAQSLSSVDEKLGDLHVLVGQYGLAQEDFARARTQETRTHGDPVRRLDLWRKESDCWTQRAEYDQAMATLEAADHELATPELRSIIPDTSWAALNVSRAHVHFRLGHLAQAEAAADKALSLVRHPEPLAEPMHNHAADLVAARAEDVLASVLALRGRMHDAEATYRKGLMRREKLGDQGGIARSLGSLSTILARRGATVEAEVYCRRALAIQETIGDLRGMATILNYLGIVLIDQGKFTAAEECIRRSLTMHEKSDSQRGTAVSLNYLSVILVNRGELASAWTYLHQSLALREHIKDVRGIAWTRRDIGNVFLEQGGPHRAIIELRQARRLARRMGMPEIEALATIDQAYASLQTNRLPAAESLYARACFLVEHYQLEGAMVSMVAIEIIGAELALAHHSSVDKVESAREHAQRVIQLATEYNWPKYVAQGYCLLGQCALALGNGHDAEYQLRHALDIQLNIGVTLDAARTKLRLAQVLTMDTLTGEPDEAHSLREQARQVFISSGVLFNPDSMG